MTISEAPQSNGINTYNEKPLHAALKQVYALPGDQIEVKVDGYIIDLVRGDLLIEIQTGSFSPLKNKLARLVDTHPLRLVYPVPLEKWILTRFPGETQPPRRRKSPKRGCAAHVFAQLIYIPRLMLSSNFTLEVLLTREEEVRHPVLKKHARSKGWTTEEHRLLEVVNRVTFETPEDLLELLPEELVEPFTTRELARAMHQPPRLAQKAVYSLRAMGALVASGKKGRAVLYSRCLRSASSSAGTS